MNRASRRTRAETEDFEVVPQFWSSKRQYSRRKEHSLVIGMRN